MGLFGGFGTVARAGSGLDGYVKFVEVATKRQVCLRIKGTNCTKANGRDGHKDPLRHHSKAAPALVALGAGWQHFEHQEDGDKDTDHREALQITNHLGQHMHRIAA